MHYLFLFLAIAWCVLTQRCESAELYAATECKRRPKDCAFLSAYPQCITVSCKRAGHNSTPNVDKMSVALRDKIVGQDNAVTYALGHIQTHYANLQAGHATSPLVLHFAGDNGVGKSETAKTIAEYMFRFHIGYDEHEQYAAFHTAGSQYSCKQCHDPSARAIERAEHTANLHEAIVLQLSRCETSIIVINDVQSMMWEVFGDLEMFFEGAVNYNGKTITTKKAIFIFTSDFRREHVTSHMSEPDLIKFIMSGFHEFIPGRERFQQTVTHVPFRSLEVESFTQILLNYMDDTLVCDPHLSKVTWNSDVVAFLLHVYSSDEDFRAMNGRAVTKLVQYYVRPALQDLRLGPKDKNLHVNLALTPDLAGLVANVVQSRASNREL